jgi:hypothetical protein
VGLAFSKEYSEKIDAFLLKNSQERAKLKQVKGKANDEQLHSYSLEKYGLDKETILQTFDSYIVKYGLRK